MMKNMKKFATTLASLCLAFVMLVALTGCGSDKQFSSVQDYLDAQKDQIEEAKQQIDDNEMSLEITADGDTLVYRYIYKDNVEVKEDDKAEVEASFEASIDMFKTQFDAVLDEMAELIDVKEPAVRLSYENPDGTVIYTHTFTKTE